jgi:hypothetical protein
MDLSTYMTTKEEWMAFTLFMVMINFLHIGDIQSPLEIMINRKQPKKFTCLVSMMTNDAGYTRKIKSNICVAEATFSPAN